MGDLVIKIKRRDFWIAFSVLIVFVCVGFGYAYNSGADPSVMGHSSEEIEGYTFQPVGKYLTLESKDSFAFTDISTNVLDLAVLTGEPVPDSARFALIRGEIDMNAYSNSPAAELYVGSYPVGGDFTGFNANDNYLLTVDGEDDISHEAQNQGIRVVSLDEATGKKVGWMLKGRSDGTGRYNVRFWLEGYYLG